MLHSEKKCIFARSIHHNNIKNMKTKCFLPSVAVLLAMTFCLTACTPDDVLDILDDEKEQKDDNGSTNNNKDAVTVTADGALVSRGNFSINFPKGTFDKDTKIVVSAVKQGSICGADEVSEFCKVVMPVSAAKKMTVWIKSDVRDDDIVLVAYMPCRSMHDDEPSYSETCLDVTYDNGEYKATLPAFENGSLTDTFDFSVGLAHRAQFSSKADMGKARETRSMEGLTEGNISWYYDMTRKFKTDNLLALTTVIDELNTDFREAVKKIHSLGFSVRTKRHIPIQFKKMNDCGLFKQSPVLDEWSHIELNENLILSNNIDHDELKRTIIHELFHYFQAEYDARWYYSKYHDCKGDELLMYESGGNWIEKYMNNGKPPKTIYTSRLPNFLKGLVNLKEIYTTTDGKFDIGPARQTHGYAMGALLEYLTQGGNEGKLLDFYEYWVRHSKPTVDNLKYLAEKCDLGTFDGGYDVFVLSCCLGDVIPGLNFDELYADMQRFDVSSNTFTASGVCYPYGANIIKLHVYASATTSLLDKNMVVRQEAANAHTYVVRPLSNGQFYQYETVVAKGDSVVIKGSDLEQLRKAGEALFTDIYLVNSTYSSSSTERFTVTATMLDADGPTVSPTQLLFPADGGTQSVKIEPAGYKRFGCSLTDEQKQWITAKAIKGGTLEFTVEPNNTGQKRTTVVTCYVTNEQNPTEAQKRKLPVTIVQEASEVFIRKMEDIFLSAYFMAQETYNNGVETTSKKGMLELNGYTFLQNNNYTCSYTKSGTTLHFDASVKIVSPYTSKTNDYTLSFDIVGFSKADNFRNCKVQNLKGTYINNSIGATEQIELNDIPFFERNPLRDDYGSYTFKGTQGDGVKVINYFYKFTEGSFTQTRTCINDPANEFKLYISFHSPEFENN